MEFSEIFFFYLLLSIFGSVLGSFLNVVIDRLSTGRGIVGGRSYCEHCQKPLSPIDLIPIISFLFLKGKCRFCKKKIPFRLVVVEMFSGMMFILLGYMNLYHGYSLISVISLGVIFWCFLGIIFADIEYGIIPDLLVIVSTISTIIFLYSSNLLNQNHFFSGICALLFFLALFAITRGRGMGFGDVKLSFVLGLLLGFPSIIVALYIAFLTGASCSIILVICRKLRFFGSTIPFGPFLIFGAITSFFWGDMILHIFISHFL